MNKEALQSVIAALREGRTPSLSVEDFPCFSPEATEGNQHVEPTYLDVVAKSLTADDAPTFERALRAMEEGDLAWLGFKIDRRSQHDGLRRHGEPFPVGRRRRTPDGASAR